MSGKCSASEELVALLYDELDAASRYVIEDHLAGCDACAGEFADLSFARLDVYEWHRDEFVEMATPRIVIPYAEAVRRSSWLETFRGLFAFSGQWATAGAALAAVAVVFVGVWMYGSKPNEVAEVGPKNSALPEIERPLGSPTPVASDSGSAGRDVESQPLRISAKPAKKQPVTAAKTAASPAPRSQTANQPVRPKQTTPPRLNDFEDEDDTTLRLGDLLAEVDTRN